MIEKFMMKIRRFLIGEVNPVDSFNSKITYKDIKPGVKTTIPENGLFKSWDKPRINKNLYN